MRKKKLKRVRAKARKLAYIRQKNKLRAGATLYITVKAANGITDMDKYERAVYNVFLPLQKAAERKWKMLFLCHNTEFAQVEDDFVKELITIRFTLKRTRNKK